MGIQTDGHAVKTHDERWTIILCSQLYQLNVRLVWESPFTVELDLISTENDRRIYIWTEYGRVRRRLNNKHSFVIDLNWYFSFKQTNDHIAFACILPSCALHTNLCSLPFCCDFESGDEKQLIACMLSLTVYDLSSVITIELWLHVSYLLCNR